MRGQTPSEAAKKTDGWWNHQVSSTSRCFSFPTFFLYISTVGCRFDFSGRKCVIAPRFSRSLYKPLIQLPCDPKGLFRTLPRYLLTASIASSASTCRRCSWPLMVEEQKCLFFVLGNRNPQPQKGGPSGPSILNLKGIRKRVWFLFGGWAFWGVTKTRVWTSFWVGKWELTSLISWQFSCFLSRVEGIDMGDWKLNWHSTNTPGQFKDVWHIYVITCYSYI